MLKNMIAISSGASVGAILRWQLGIALNGLFQLIPFGTLTANLLGGYLIGIAISVFNCFPAIGPEVRLFVITGFLGGLTTFSTFTVEVGLLLQEQRLVAAALLIMLHVCGSLLLLFLGMALLRWARPCCVKPRFGAGFCACQNCGQD